MARGRFEIATVFKAVDKLSRPVRNMGAKIKRGLRNTRIALVVTRKEFAAFGRVAKRSMKVFGFAVAAGMAFAARSVVKSGMEFEQAITNVAAVGLQTRDQIRDLEKQARKLGETTKFTATEAAQAMEILAKAGFDNQQILAATPGVLNAAAASGLEMAEVANVMSNTLKGMGLEMERAGDVADILALASSRTNSTIGSLGQSMQNVAATARQLNIPLVDTVAAVASLQDVGLDASVAGSSLNTMLTKLAKPPKSIAKAMKKANLSFKDAQGNLKTFPEVLDTINKLAEQSGGNLDRVGILADLVGLRGQKAASNLGALFETGKLEKLTAELKNARGAAQEMADIRMDTLTGDLQILNSQIEGLKIDIFSNAGGDLRRITQDVSKWITLNKDLIIQMASDPFGPLREARRIVEDLFLGMARFSDSVNSFFGSFAPGQQAAIKTVPSQVEVEQQRAAEDARRLGFAPEVVAPQDRGTTNETRESVDVTLTTQRDVKATPSKRLPKQIKIQSSGSFQFAGP